MQLTLEIYIDEDKKKNIQLFGEKEELISMKTTEDDLYISVEAPKFQERPTERMIPVSEVIHILNDWPSRYKNGALEHFLAAVQEGK